MGSPREKKHLVTETNFKGGGSNGPLEFCTNDPLRPGHPIPPASITPQNWAPVLGNVARLRVPRGWLYRAVAGMCFVPDPCFETQWECYVPECFEPAGLKRDPQGPCRAHARAVRETLEAESDELGR